MQSQWIWIWCGLVAAASVAGGLLPTLMRWTHRRLQMALSFVSGVMLGVALFHMVPHAVMTRAEHAGTGHDALDPIMVAVAAGFLGMFFLQRFASFHQHEAPEASCAHGHDHAHDHDHAPVGRLTWTGAALGLTLHSLLEGVALAASVLAADSLHPGLAAAGFGTFLVILLHKPFDAMTLVTLFSAGGRSGARVHVLNLLFALIVPLGAALFLLGFGSANASAVSIALAFSAGTFLCIAGSDLLPELQFHRHDRLALSIMLTLGLGVAWGVGRLESSQHAHDHTAEAMHGAAGHADHADHAGHDHAGHDHAHDHAAPKETVP